MKFFKHISLPACTGLAFDESVGLESAAAGFIESSRPFQFLLSIFLSHSLLDEVVLMIVRDVQLRQLTLKSVQLSECYILRLCVYARSEPTALISAIRCYLNLLPVLPKGKELVVDLCGLLLRLNFKVIRGFAALHPLKEHVVYCIDEHDE